MACTLKKVCGRTWSVGRLGDGLAHPLGKLARSRQNGRVGLERRDELDQLHDRDRIDCEELMSGLAWVGAAT